MTTLTKEEHNKLLNDLRTSQDEAGRVAIIAQLESDYTGVLSERDTATAKEKKASQQADTYRNINNELWLKLSNQEKVVEKTETINTDTEKKEVANKLTYGDLEAEIYADAKGGK